MDDARLLREYVINNSEAAFEALVSRYLHFVHSAAMRQVRDPQMAEEVAQVVFIILAKKAGRINDRTILSGWLFKTTRFVALTQTRAATRRRQYEQKLHMQSEDRFNTPDQPIWEQISPLLDEALAKLGEKDRQAVLLRFFQNKSLAEVGNAFGTGEDAARMRINRTLAKLNRYFNRHGISSTTAILAGVISANSVQSTPVLLTKTITAGAVAKGATASTSTLTLIKGALKIMAWTKAKTAVVTAVVAASVVVPLLVQYQAQARLRDGDETLRGQAAQLAAQKTENDRLSNLAANSSLSKEQIADLQNLRAEVGPLRQQAQEVAQLQQENRQLEAKTGQDKPKTPMQIKEEAMAKMSYLKNWVIGFRQYAEKHNGKFPTNFEEAAVLAPDKSQNQSNVTPDQFEIVFQGSLSSLKEPQDIIVLREKEAQNAGESSHPPGQWTKVYLFADGHSTLHHEPSNNFDDYEKAHMISSPANQ